MPAHAVEKFSVAPMMDWTDRHCRAFHRILTRRALLYTEMVTADAVVHGDRKSLLGGVADGAPVALQLGGSDPARLAEAARIGQDFGYCRINLNVGCPSDRVQAASFGAALMARPDVVARCVAAMTGAVAIPVTVKCRIGIDDMDVVEGLDRFVDTVAAAGCTTFIVHARKAWLKGLSPKDNRHLPPLDYPRVYDLKARRGELEIVINGGISGLEEAEAHLRTVDGVMVGRAAYHRPWLLADVDRRLFAQPAPVSSRADALRAFLPYLEAQLAAGERLHAIARHLLGLFHGEPGARTWRRALSERSTRPGAGIEVIEQALTAVEHTRAAA